MRDREFLIWLHERLEHVHKDPERVDFLWKLRAIIAVTPPGRETTSSGGASIKELLARDIAWRAEHPHGH